MPAFRPTIEPDVFRWAREWAGVDIADLAAWNPRYPRWETGEASPTMKQVEDLARRLNVPLGYFFLPEPPEIEMPLPDFRTLKDRKPARPSPNLVEVMDQMMRRSEWMREFLIEEGEDPLPFVGSTPPTAHVEEVAADIRATLGLEADWARHQKDHAAALKHLREAAEDARIMVVMAGYAGRSTRKTLDVHEFRGFVIADRYAPLIFINSRDVEPARLFTLAHELAHLWVGQDAVVDLPRMIAADDEVEQFCNRVAAEFLVPAALFDQVWNQRLEIDDAVRMAGRAFKVSQIVVARRALDLGHIGRDDFFEFYSRRKQHYADEAARRTGGGNFWNTQGTRIGRLFAQSVIRATRQGQLLYTDAYEMTGLKARTFDELADHLRFS